MTSRATHPLAILILSDGRPGHFHLSEGVAAAIARRRPVVVERREIARPRWLPGRALARLARGHPSAAHVVSRLTGLTGTLPATDLVISAGGETLAANVALAGLLSVPNVFCGTLRHMPAERFSLVVSSYARHAGLPRHLVTLKPSGIDPDTFDGRPQLAPGAVPGVAGLLIGGDSGLFRYTAAEWDSLVAFVGDSHRSLGISWIVSTSRRSPDAVGDAVARLAASEPGAIAEFIDFRTAGPGTLPRLFAGAEAVLVTEDSSSMISEAVCARLPVVGVAPATHSFKDEEGEYRAFMRDEGWCRFVPLSALTPERFVAELGHVRALPGNHLDRLADKLEQRLPGLFA